MSFDGHKHFFLLNLGMELMSYRIGKCLALRDTSRLFSQRSRANLYPKQLLGFLGGSGVKNLPTNAGDRCGFNPWFENIPWKRKWQLTPVFLPQKFYGQRSLVG